MTKPKLIVPKHVWDGAEAEKKKNELEKVPKPVGWRIVLFPLKLKKKTKEVTSSIIRVTKTSSRCEVFVVCLNA